MSEILSLSERMKRRGFTLPTMKKGEKKKRGIEKDVNGRRRKTRRRFDASVPVEYVNWMHGDDDDDRKMVKTWKEYVECIGDEKLKAFPVVQQAKNDCSLCAAITCWEVQQQRKFMKRPDQLGSYKKTREEGAHLADQVPRVWGRGTGRSRPYSMCKHKMRLRLEELIEHVRRGVVYMGLEQLGYPWANRAVSDEFGSKEKFIVPRYDPYNNPWEPTRRSGADGHAVCVIGMFHCEDNWGDSAPKGYPKRNLRDKIGNVFVTKDSVLPCGWSDPKRPWTKSLAGVAKRPREEFAYSLIPFDLLTKPMQDGGLHRRAINDAWFVPMLRG